VRWHALAVVGTGILVGGVLGIALGRQAFIAFARRLGGAPEPVVSPLWLGIVALAVLAVGLLAASERISRGASASTTPGPDRAARPG
jgi:hypothetical protein